MTLHAEAATAARDFALADDSMVRVQLYTRDDARRDVQDLSLVVDDVRADIHDAPEVREGYRRGPSLGLSQFPARPPS